MGNGGTTALPTPDATGTIAISATAGKIILYNTTVVQSGSNPVTNYPITPNPAKGFINVLLTKNNNKPVTIQLIAF